MGKKEFKKIESDLQLWLPKIRDDEIEGSVTMISEGQYGKQYKVQGEKQFWTTPSHKVLQNRMKDVKVGEYIKIVFTGTEAPKVKGQNPTAMYDVYLME